MLLPPRNCLLPLLAVSLVEDLELLEKVASIGKDAAKEATKNAAAEGQEHAVGGAQEPPKEAEKAHGSASGSGVLVEEKTPLQNMSPPSSFGTWAGIPQPTSSQLALVLAQPSLGAPSYLATVSA